MNYVTLFKTDVEHKITQVCTVLDNVVSEYDNSWTVGDVPDGLTHYSSGVFYTERNIEQVQLQKMHDLKYVLSERLNRTFAINGSNFTFSNIELSLPSALEGACILRNDIGVLVSLNNNQVSQLKNLALIRSITLHNAYTNLKLQIQNATTLPELDAIDPYSL